MKPWTPGKLWLGETAVILASGPSITDEQVGTARQCGARVIAINTTYKLAPWADMLYACDEKVWDWHEGAPDFAGLKVTQDEAAADRWGLLWVKGINERGLSVEPGVVHTGKNSGYQAINIATLLGVTTIYLCGFDLKIGANGASHWHGDHPNGIRSTYAPWRPLFDDLAHDAELLGIKIFNCSDDSALTSFQRCSLSEVFNANRCAAG